MSSGTDGTCDRCGSSRHYTNACTEPLDPVRLLVVGTGRIIPPLPPGNYDMVILPYEPLDVDYGALERRMLAEVEIRDYAHPLRGAKTALRKDWLRHWPAAAQFLRPLATSKTIRSDVATLAALSIEVRRIRRRNR